MNPKPLGRWSWLFVMMVTVFLAACNGDISKAKNKQAGDGPTYQVLIEEKAGCKSVDWSAFSNERDQKFVKASCLLDPKNGVQEAATRRAAQTIGLAAQELKSDYDKKLKEVDRYAVEVGNSLSSLTPEQQPSGKRRFDEIAVKLQQLQEGKADFYANVDASKENDLKALDERFGPDAKVSGDFIFVISKESAQLVAMQVVVGGKAHDVPDFDVLTLLTFINRGDKASQDRFWGNFVGSRTIDLKNLVKLRGELNDMR